MDPTKRQVAASQVHLMVIINEVYLMGKIFKLYTSMTNIHKVLKPFYAYYFKYEVDVWIENGNVLFTVRNFVVDIISSKYMCVCVCCKGSWHLGGSTMVWIYIWKVYITQAIVGSLMTMSSPQLYVHVYKLHVFVISYLKQLNFMLHVNNF